ncbi:hypothetical protein [Flavobacterium sp. LB1P62]|uniref:hypothetical protein n=1 Tax=unclassified Flavobacterium TaxID=196869 RepID=UPI003AADC0BD
MPKLRIVFKQTNLDYNQSYANQYFAGKESPGNYKYMFSRTHFIQVESFALFKNIDYNYVGNTNKGIDSKNSLFTLKCVMISEKSCIPLWTEKTLHIQFCSL